MTSVPVPVDQTRTPLRRATYVHVSDLTSAYNIDHVLLEQELKRVKAESEEGSLTNITSKTDDSDVDPSGVAPELDVTLATNPQKRLQPPRSGYNLCVLVGKVNVVVDKRRVDGSRVRLAEVEVGDETGTVSLRARDEQIDVLEKVSKRSGAVVLRNCTLELYLGKHIRLAVTKWGKLCVYPDNIASTPPPPSKMNFDRNFSLIDLSIVASEMVGVQPEGPHGSKQNRSSTESSDAGGRHSSSKTGGQSQTKQQFHSSPRRNNRDRRHSKGKPGSSPHHTHYNVAHGDRGILQPQHGQMRYRGMPNFSGFEQGIDMRQFPYPHGGQQEVLAPGSAQHLLLQQQQYEMQQRQFHQMYTHGQDHHLPTMNQGQAPGMILQPGNTSGGFATSGADPSVIPLVGSNSMFMPIGLPTSPVQSSLSPMSSAHTQEYRTVIPSSHTSTGEEIDKTPGQRANSPPMSQTGQTEHKAVSPDGSQLTAGKMNPEAIAFAPSAYIAQSYFPAYHPSQSTAGGTYTPAPSHAIVYGPQGTPVVHLPTTQASSKPAIPPGQAIPLSPNRSQPNILGEADSNAAKDAKSPER